MSAAKANRAKAGRSEIAAASERARAALPLIVKAARKDPAVFCQYVLKDEYTGDSIRLCDMHCEWHDLLTQHSRVVIWSHAEAGKSAQLSVGRVLFELGSNPNLRVLILCQAAEAAKKIVQSLRQYIETSVELRQVFPHLKRGRLWQESAFTVERKSKSRDPSVVAAGFGSKRVLGSRLDLIVIDDYLSPSNTMTEKARASSYQWLKAIVESRRTPNARLWFVGNAWHKRDAMHLYSKEENTVARRYSVLDDRDTVTGQVIPGRKGKARWSPRWSHGRYHEEQANRGRVEAMRSLDCIAADDSTEWVSEADVVVALRAGHGRTLPPRLNYVPPGYVVISGVDPSSGEGADLTAIVTIAVEPRGKRGQGRRVLLDVRAGHWHGPRILEQIYDVHQRYHSIIFVESNGVQKWLKQFAKRENASIPIRAVVTGKNKLSPLHGVQSIAVECAQGGWVIPNVGGEIDATMHPEVKNLVTGLLAYSPDAHTSDHVMAAWIAREGARKMLSRVESGKQPKVRR